MESKLYTFRTLGLTGLTILALMLMVLVSTGSLGRTGDKAPQLRSRESSAAAAIVAVAQMERESIELLDIYSGMIRPWERYALGFEVAGRVKSLGTNRLDESLDEGDTVDAGQVLARLDDRILRARRSEASAQLEQTTSNLRRARELQQSKVAAITESEVENRVTELALAKAQYEMAVKNLEDAVLVSPVKATIARRMINPGESINPHQQLFELIEIDKVLLVVGVPESDIPDIQARMRRVEKNRDLREGGMIEEEDLEFRVYVELIGRNRFGAKWDRLVGKVHQIGETADEQTGLFEVEVLLPNKDGFLRPGMVARAELITSYIDGYRIPTSNVLFRRNIISAPGSHPSRAYVYTVQEETTDVEALFFTGHGTVHRARHVDLIRWVEQGDEVIVVEASQPFDTVVKRGQHRLVDNQLVQIVPFESSTSPELSTDRKRRASERQAQRN